MAGGASLSVLLILFTGLYCYTDKIACYNVSPGVAFSQNATDAVYYGLAGYSQFSHANERLLGANQSLSIGFRFCQTDGILLHATNALNSQYFSIGVSGFRLLIEFNVGQGIGEVPVSNHSSYLVLLLHLYFLRYLLSPLFYIVLQYADTSAVSRFKSLNVV